MDSAVLAELAALRAKQAALEHQVAAERQRAMQAEADKRVAEEKVNQLERKDEFMMTTVNAWRSSAESERASIFKHLEQQANQVETLVKFNNERTVHHCRTQKIIRKQRTNY
jgi:hypothetical protein